MSISFFPKTFDFIKIKTSLWNEKLCHHQQPANPLFFCMISMLIIENEWKSSNPKCSSKLKTGTKFLPRYRVTQFKINIIKVQPEINSPEEKKKSSKACPMLHFFSGSTYHYWKTTKICMIISKFCQNVTTNKKNFHLWKAEVGSIVLGPFVLKKK